MSASSTQKQIYPISEGRRAEILARIKADQDNRPQHIAEMSVRQRTGIAIAHKAAKILKEQFHATRVVLFGSLLSPEDMYERSDIDIAVWGLADDQLFTAWCAIDDCLDYPSPFPHIDLVPVEKAFLYIQKSIEEAHIEL